jgi:hypothetical protein
MATESELPEQFQELASFLGWALPTERERSAKRHGASIIEIRAFYDAVVARLAEILAFLNQFSPEDPPADVNRLFLLTLSLAEVAPAIENFGQPGVIDGYDYSRFIPLHD